MTLAEFIPLAISGSLFLIVLSLGLQADWRDATYLFRHPGLLARSILSMNGVMLALVVGVAAVLPLDPAIKIALVALAVSPVPPILPSKQERAGGTESYAIGLLVSAALFAVVLVPVSIELVGRLFGTGTHVPIGRIVPALLVSVIAPLGLGIVLRALVPAFARRAARPISLLGAGFLVLACLPVLVKTLPAFGAMVGNGVLLVLLAFTLVGIAVGHWLGGPDPHDRTVLALATATRHPGVALAIASATFPDEKAVPIVVLYHLVIGGIVSIPYVRWRMRAHAAEEAERER